MALDETMADLGVSRCPHRPGSPEHSAWMRHWLDHENVLRRVDGRMAEDSARAKATANAQFRAAGYGRPDPVTEILGTEERSTSDTRQYVVTIEIDTTALQATLERVASAVIAFPVEVLEEITREANRRAHFTAWSGPKGGRIVELGRGC